MRRMSNSLATLPNPGLRLGLGQCSTVVVNALGCAGLRCGCTAEKLTHWSSRYRVVQDGEGDSVAQRQLFRRTMEVNRC